MYTTSYKRLDLEDGYSTNLQKPLLQTSFSWNLKPLQHKVKLQTKTWRREKRRLCKSLTTVRTDLLATTAAINGLTTWSFCKLL